MEFLENRRSSENQKNKKLPEKWTFLSLAFYNAASLQTVESHIWCGVIFESLGGGDPESHFLVTFALN